MAKASSSVLAVIMIPTTSKTTPIPRYAKTWRKDF